MENSMYEVWMSEFKGVPEATATCAYVQTTLHYGSIWLKFRLVEQFLLGVFDIELYHLWNDLRDKRKSLSMALLKPGFIMAENRDW
jgi:hypothetical protein